MHSCSILTGWSRSSNNQSKGAAHLPAREEGRQVNNRLTVATMDVPSNWDVGDGSCAVLRPQTLAAPTGRLTTSTGTTPEPRVGPEALARPLAVQAEAGDKAGGPGGGADIGGGTWSKKPPGSSQVMMKACVESTSASGAPNDSSLSHFSAMTQPCLSRSSGEEPASPRYRAGVDGVERCDDKILFPHR